MEIDNRHIKNYLPRKMFGLLALFCLELILAPFYSPVFAQQNIRQEISLNSNWRTIADDTNINAYKGFEKSVFSDKNWVQVNVPHNWDTYGGYRRLKHGNKHGYAWYRKVFT